MLRKFKKQNDENGKRADPEAKNHWELKKLNKANA